MPHVLESAKQNVTKILRSFKEAIVCNVLARVIPDAFGGIQFWPVGRKWEDLHVTTVRFEPVVRFLLLVIGGVVLNAADAVAASPEGRQDHLLHESQIGLPLKAILLM